MTAFSSGLLDGGHGVTKRTSVFKGDKATVQLYGSQRKHGTITQFCFNAGPALNTIDRHQWAATLAQNYRPTGICRWVEEDGDKLELGHS